MKTLFVHGDVRPPGEGGGAESLLRDQARGLTVRGHECAWYNGSGDFAKQVDLFKPDVVHFLTFHCYPQMGMQPLSYCQENGIPHLIHIQDYWHFCGNRMMMINNVKSCPAVTGICDDKCQDYIGDRYLSIVNKSYIVAGNQYTADIYKRNGSRCDAVVELGVDTDLFSPGKRGGDPRLYTSCAQISGAWKGMFVIQDALHRTDYTCMMITGKPRSVVAEELKKADVFIFPSLYEETFGLSLCEAMACGCACIGSDVAGSKAQIETGVTGMIVKHGDTHSLKHAIMDLMNDKWLRETLGAAAREHVVKDHSIEAMSMRWEKAYQEVLNGS